VYLVRTNIFYFGRGASVRVWRRPHLHLGRPTPPTSAARRSSGRNSSTRPTTPTGATPAPPFGERGVRHHHIKRESATDHVTGSEAGLLTGNRDYSASAPNRCRQCCAFVFASWWTVRRTGTTVRSLPRTTRVNLPLSTNGPNPSTLGATDFSHRLVAYSYILLV
jgi:hypothetical protein